MSVLSRKLRRQLTPFGLRFRYHREALGFEPTRKEIRDTMRRFQRRNDGAPKEA